MRRIAILYSIILLATLSACNFSEEDKNLVVTLEPEFSVSLLEQLGETPSLHFEVQTIENRPCEDFTIDLDFTIESKVISLYIKEVIEPEICVPNEAPAVGVIDVGALDNGNYEISVTLKDAIENRGELIVRNDEYQILMETENGVRFNEETFHKIPKNTIWGYVAYDNEDLHEFRAQELLNKLNEFNLDSDLTDGDYGYFSISGGKMESLRNMPEKNIVSPFVFRADNNLQETIDLMLEFKNSYSGGDLEAGLYLWDGRNY